MSPVYLEQSCFLPGQSNIMVDFVLAYFGVTLMRANMQLLKILTRHEQNAAWHLTKLYLTIPYQTLFNYSLPHEGLALRKGAGNGWWVLYSKY